MKNYIIPNKFKIYSFITGLLFLSTSCTSQIEVDMPNDKIDHTEVYKNVATIKAALNSLYLDFQSSAIFSKSNVGVSFNLSLFTDELNFYGTNVSTVDMYESNIVDTNTYIGTWWNNAYQNIYSINAFIKGVENSTVLDIDQKKQFLGEAYTLRALYYHYLTILFGDSAYTTSTDYNLNKILKRLPYQEVLLKVESDLAKAIELLDYSYRDPNKFYVNKSVALVILIENYIAQKI